MKRSFDLFASLAGVVLVGPIIAVSRFWSGYRIATIPFISLSGQV